jgi:hypothetical protein
LAASGFARAFEIKIEAVLLRHIRQDIADERFETVSDDLSPTMG